MSSPQVIKDYREKLTNDLIEQLQKGTAPWQIPWEKKASRLPVNALNGKYYHGSNTINLLLKAQAKGWNDNRWCTYAQAKKMGWSIKPGEKASYIIHVKYNVEYTKLDDNNNPVKDNFGRDIKIKSRAMSHVYSVFNGSQINGIPKLPEPKVHVWEPNKRAENILINSKANILHENISQAFYSPVKDEIYMPLKSMFKDDQKYYATALHEMGHWTGHKSRLDRDLSGFFGSEKYAREELRAEIASMFVSDQVGVPNKIEDHAAYVNSWIEILKKDKSEIFSISREASDIADFVMSFDKEIAIEGNNDQVKIDQVENTANVDLSISDKDLIKPEDIEKRILQPRIATNASDRFLAEVRYRGWGLDSRRFDTEREAQKWLDNHSGEMSKNVAFQYAEKMNIEPRKLYDELLKSDPGLIKAVEKMEASINNPSFQDYENVFKEYEAKMEMKSPGNDIEIE